MSGAELRPRLLTLLVAATALAVTVVVSAVPFIGFAYRSPGLHVVLETAAAAIAFISAFLVYGRFRQTERVDEFVLASGLGVLAFTNFFLAAIPTAVATSGETFRVWEPLTGRFLAALLIASSTVLPATPVPRLAPIVRTLPVLAAFALGAVALVIASVGGGLPLGIDPASAPGGTRTPSLDAHPALLAAQLASAAVYAAAAVGFTRRAERSDDVLRRWFGVGSALAAVSSLNYFLYPSLYSAWIHTGDVFRVLFYVALLVGSGLELARYWRRLAETAVFEERRRIARDLHDGLAQELAFITRRARRLAPTSGNLEPLIAEMGAASQRALDDSRRAIAALTRPIDERLDVTLAQTAQEVASRAGARVALDLAPDVEVSPKTREELTRIIREAVTNAAHHARGATIKVELRSGDRIRLRVLDDGEGFDLAQAAELPGRYGLKTMRARAEALGADFRVRSVPGGGTQIDLTL